jgi:hypothetical protein
LKSVFRLRRRTGPGESGAFNLGSLARFTILPATIGLIADVTPQPGNYSGAGHEIEILTAEERRWTQMTEERGFRWSVGVGKVVLPLYSATVFQIFDLRSAAFSCGFNLVFSPCWISTTPPPEPLRAIPAKPSMPPRGILPPPLHPGVI